MTQPYPFTYTADTQHAIASAAKASFKSASRQRSVGTANAFIATNPEPATLVSECDFFVQFWRTRKGPNQFADAMRDAE